MDITAFAINLGITVFGGGVAWGLMRASVAAAKTEAEEARKSAAALHRRVDEHAERITSVERDVSHHGKELERSLIRIEAQLVNITSRLDRLASGAA